MFLIHTGELAGPVLVNFSLCGDGASVRVTISVKLLPG